jgi:hypothetical protein
MIAMLNARTERSADALADMRSLRAITDRGRLLFDADGEAVEPTHYAFGQMCGQLEAPAAFLRRVPDELAVANLQHCWNTAEARAEGRTVQLLTTTRDSGVAKLRGVTGPNYGRIWDREMVQTIKRITEASGVWEVPTAFQMPGQPRIVEDVTKENTTLYAGDRDVFLFLVDQTRPIEIGKLPDGSPDLYFRGFYAWNGECGGVSNGVGTFLYRYVCCNRIIWGQKGFQRLSIRHTKNAAERFVREVMPALESFVSGATDGVVSGLEFARQARIARDQDERLAFLTKLDLTPKQAETISQRVIDEEGHPAETVWDMIQGITSFARTIPWQDERVKVESVADQLLEMCN